MCDNCKQAVYELELQWGRGVLDVGELKRILNREELNEPNITTTTA